MRKYFKIKTGVSVYDSKLLVYFAERMSLHNSRFKRLKNLLKSQKYKCAKCNLIFTPNDIIELHHILQNGIRTEAIQFVHGHCHDSIHGEKS
jgi:RNA-directed DNA polymerase